MTENKEIERKIKKWSIWGIVFICVVGSLMHFVYDLTGESFIVGLIAPVNESVWEHLKLAFYPTLIWWIISYFVLSKKYDLSIEKWLYSTVIALVVTPLFIVSFYYVTTEGLGVRSTILDILSLFIGVILAQFLALYIYKNSNITKFNTYLSIFIIVIMITSFILFTIKPPHLPIFMDNNTKTYGIYNQK